MSFCKGLNLEIEKLWTFPRHWDKQFVEVMFEQIVLTRSPCFQTVTYLSLLTSRTNVLKIRLEKEKLRQQKCDITR